VSIEAGKFILGENESSHGTGRVPEWVAREVRDFYPFSPGLCSFSMLIKYAESSILVGHTLVLTPSLVWSLLLFLLSKL
jgi:hypothetical protein